MDVKKFKTLSLIVLLGLIAVSPVVFTGCTTTGTSGTTTPTPPATTALNVLDAMLTTVSTAEDAWAKWRAQKLVAISKLPADQQPAALADLASARAKIADADAKFRVAFEAAISGVSAAINSGASPSIADALAAGAALLALFPLLQH